MHYNESTYQTINIHPKKAPLKKLPTPQAEFIRRALIIALVLLVGVSFIYSLRSDNSQADIQAASNFNYQSEFALTNPMDGGTAPAWMPFLGRATVGCTSGNPHPTGGCRTSEGGPYHPWPAIDYHMPAGKPVRATGPGVVTRVNHNTSKEEEDPTATAGTDGGEGVGGTSTPDALEARAGFYVAIKHEGYNGSVYKHLSEAFVREGETVERGQVIGLVGKTASPTYHLHYDEQQYIDKTDLRFNTPESRTPLGNTQANAGGNVKNFPGSLGFGGGWERVPYGTVINVSGYSTAPQTVSNAADLRTKLRELSTSTAEGPFIVKLDANITVNTPLVYSGNEMLILEGTDAGKSIAGNNSRILNVTSTAPVEIRNLDIKNGISEFNGGAVWSRGSLTLIETKFKDNRSSGKGGAIYSEGSVAIARSFLADNTAVGDGGAVYAKSVRVAESTFNKNTAANGGAIFSLTTTDTSNTTLSRNVALGKGGAVASLSRVQIRHTTFKENRAVTSGASIFTPAQLVALASVSADPQGTSDCDVYGVTALGHNVEAGNSCQFETQNIGANEGLDDDLAWNGGGTPTFRPLQNSVLRNAYTSLPVILTGYKSPTVCDTSSAIDQRGGYSTSTGPPAYSRPQGGSCDIGAVDVL